MSSPQRPRSAPAPGHMSRQEYQEREIQSLSKNRSKAGGGLAPISPRHEPTDLPSGSSDNDLPVPPSTNAESSLEDRNKVSSETASGSQNPAGFTENDPWKRKTLLTLDGGGIRGYSSLLILRAVMIEIARIEQENQVTHSAHPLLPQSRDPVRVQRTKTTKLRAVTNIASTVFGPSQSSHYFPSHYFDYIAGTSTGGIIAIMIGRLSMTVDECLETYRDLAGEVFGHPRLLHFRNSLWPKDKYDSKNLESIIERVVEQREGSGSAIFPQRNENMCRTMVLTWEKRHVMRERVVHILRSYNHPKTSNLPNEWNPGEMDNYPISHVAMATAAAPFHFKAVKLDKSNPARELIDGAFGANNPSEEAWYEVKQMSNDNERAVRVLLSIGTGRNVDPDSHQVTGWKMFISYINAAAKWATQSQGTHNTMERIIPGRADYYRLNVEKGLSKMKLDEWKGKKGHKTLELIEAKTNAYLQLEEVQKQISAAAQQLVQIRHTRSGQPDRDKWETFCHGVEYYCPVSACDRGRKKFTDRLDLRHHIEADHSNYSTDTLEDLLDRGKHFPLHDFRERDERGSE